MDDFDIWYNDELSGWKYPLTANGVKMIAHNAYVEGLRDELERCVTTIGKFFIEDPELVREIISAILKESE